MTSYKDINDIEIDYGNIKKRIKEAIADHKYNSLSEGIRLYAHKARAYEKYTKKRTEGDFKVVFCGVFSSGKTSLINALLNIKLPTGIKPVTKAVTRIEYGTKKEAFLKIDDNQPVAISFDRINRIVTGAEKPKCKYGVEIVIKNPSKFLRQGITIIDTPGFEEEQKDIDEITKRALKEADLAIMCFNPTKLADIKEREFLDDLQKQVDGNCVFVINCMNYIQTLEEVQDIDYRAKEVFGNYGNKLTVGQGVYFKICSLKENPGFSLDKIDTWIPSLVSFAGTNIKKYSAQANLYFLLDDIKKELNSIRKLLDNELRILNAESKKAAACEVDRLYGCIDDLSAIKDGELSLLTKLTQKIEYAIDNCNSPSSFVSDAKTVINNICTNDFMAVIISAIAKRNDLYLSEVIGNNYIAMMRKAGEKSKIAAPTTYQKKVYKGPIGIIPSYITVYNDYKSKAKENFRIFGRPYVKEVVESYFAEYITKYRNKVNAAKTTTTNNSVVSNNIICVKNAKSALDETILQIESMIRNTMI